MPDDGEQLRFLDALITLSHFGRRSDSRFLAARASGTETSYINRPRERGAAGSLMKSAIDYTTKGR